MNRTLVTGGSGFLGSFIADRLTDLGHEVTLFDRRPSPWLRPGQQMIVGDLAERDKLAAAAAGCSAIYHMAALADINEARDLPLEAAETNILGTVHALEAAREVAAERFLFASTVYVYSRAGGFYRCSKQACESYVEEYQRRFGLPFTILRYGSLYGPRAGDSNGVYRLLRQALAKEAIHIPGTPDDTREYIHVEDAARLSVDALDEQHRNRHLVVTGSHPTRLKDLFTMFSEILGRELAIEYDDAGKPSDGHYRMTPYSFNPRLGRKLTSTCYVDMGEGLLQLLEQMHERPLEEVAAGGEGSG